MRVEESVRTAIAYATNVLGRIDYAVHSAGVSPAMECVVHLLLGRAQLTLIQIPAGTFDPIAEASFADFKHLLDVNVNGTFLLTSLMSAAMKTQGLRAASAADPARGTTRGSIVNLSSVSSSMAVANMV